MIILEGPTFGCSFCDISIRLDDSERDLLVCNHIDMAVADLEQTILRSLRFGFQHDALLRGVISSEKQFPSNSR